MNIVTAFMAWESNANPRTHADLVAAMRDYSDQLDKVGIQPCWHEDLQVNCHDELINILEMMGGARGLLAA